MQYLANPHGVSVLFVFSYEDMVREGISPLSERYLAHGEKVAKAMKKTRVTRARRFLVGISPSLTLEGAAIQARMNLGKIAGTAFPEYAKAYWEAGRLSKLSHRKEINLSIAGSASLLGAVADYGLTLLGVAISPLEAVRRI